MAPEKRGSAPATILLSSVLIALIVALDPLARDPTFPKSVVLWTGAGIALSSFVRGSFLGTATNLAPLPPQGWMLGAAALWLLPLPASSALGGQVAVVAFADTVSALVLFFWAFALARRNRSAAPRMLTATLCLALLPAFLYMAGQRAGLDPVVWADAPGSLLGTMGNRYLMAAVLVLSLPLLLAHATDPRAGRWSRIATGLVASCAAFGIWTGQSQGAWLAVVAMLALAGPILLRRRGARARGGREPAPAGPVPRRALTLLIAAALVLTAGTQAYLGSRQDLADHPPAALEALARDELDVNTAFVRLALWGSAARAIAERPLRGHGPGGFVRAFARWRPHDLHLLHVAWNTRHTHSALLEWAVEGGVPGACLWIVALAWLLGDALARPLHDPEARWRVALALALAGGLVHGAVGIAPATPGVRGLFWILAGLLTGLLAPAPRAAAPHPLRRSAGALVALAACALALILGSLAARSWRAERLLVIAQAPIDAGRAAAALPALEQAQRLLPASLEVAYLLAFAELTGGRTEQALARYLEIERACPAFAELRYNIGVAHYHAERFTEAAAAFRSQIESALHSQAHLYLAASYLHGGMRAGARAVLEEMLELAAEHRPRPGRRAYPHRVTTGQAHEMLADLLAQREPPELALRHYQQADSCVLGLPEPAELVGPMRARLATKIEALGRR